MPYTEEDKRRNITRLSRIRGQARALEQAIENDGDCAAILQQLAAMRGAVQGLMANLLESHIQATLAQQPTPEKLEEMLALLRPYIVK